MKKGVSEIVKEVTSITPKPIEKVEDVKGEWIKAPFVGTYYSASSENSEPFIKVGIKVNEGDTLCILEAMKVMNEIKSPISGTILEIKSNNGSMVEFGEEMILIGN